jgi:signal transduction histidine kinase
MGLGLAIAREILRAHGGEIVLAHSGADGTVFRLNLPA